MIHSIKSTPLLLSLLLLGQLASTLPVARADEFNLLNTVDTSGDAMGGGGGAPISDGAFGRQRFTLTFDSRFGYDDNTLGQPDSERILTGTDALTGKKIYQNVNVDSSGSAFLNFALGAGYTAKNSRMTLTLGADVGVNYYFDRPGRDYDINGGLSARLHYKVTPRFTLDLSTYNAYESEGDYGATTLTNFNGQFNGGGRTPGTSAARNGDYFFTTNYLAGTYQFTPRISVVLSDTLVAFAYDDQPYITDQDRIEDYIGIEGRYLVKPTLTLALDYRFGYIDYFGVSNDSSTNFLLAGFDYSFNPRLGGGIRAGVEFRNYFDAPGDEISPYMEANLTYSLNSKASLALTMHYGIEEGDLSATNSKSDTFRVGTDYAQTFTARLSGYLSFYYSHSHYETPGANNQTLQAFDVSSLNEDTFDVAAGLRFTISRHTAAEIGYTHTTVLSQADVRAYDRNRVFAGIRLAY